MYEVCSHFKSDYSINFNSFNFKCALDGHYSPTMLCTNKMEEVLTPAKHSNKLWVVVKQCQKVKNKNKVLHLCKATAS